MNPSHSFNRRILSWVYCHHCGLILLSNEATRLAANKNCPAKRAVAPTPKKH